MGYTTLNKDEKEYESGDSYSFSNHIDNHLCIAYNDI